MNIIYFDGVCVLCNGFAKWVIAQDADKKFKFSVLGSERYEALAQKHPEISKVDSVVYQRGDEVFLRGQAIREIIHDLSTNKLVKISVATIPLFILNFGYKFVAQTRYSVFGKYDTCPLMTPEWRDRFEN